MVPGSTQPPTVPNTIENQVIRLDEHVRTLAGQYGELKGELGKVRVETETAFRSISAEMAARFDRIDGRFSAFQQEQANRSRPNWLALCGVGLSAIAVLGSMIGGAFYVVQLNVRNEMASVSTLIQAADAERSGLRSEVTGVHSDVLSLDRRVSDNTAALRNIGDSTARAFTEVETQVRSGCISDNLRFSDLQRWVGILAQKTLQIDVPELPYNPCVALGDGGR